MFDTTNANCVDMDLNIFFPDNYGGGNLEAIEDAKAICYNCPVKADCLAWAMKNREDGIWGGTTPVERELLSKPTRITAFKKAPKYVRKAPISQDQIDTMNRYNKGRSEAAAKKAAVLLSWALEILGDTVNPISREVAELRIAHLDWAFTDIAAHMTIPTTKDAVASRARKLVQDARLYARANGLPVK